MFADQSICGAMCEIWGKSVFGDDVKPAKATPLPAATTKAMPLPAVAASTTDAQDALGIKLSEMVSNLSEEDQKKVEAEVVMKTAAIPVQLISAGVIHPGSSKAEMEGAIMAEATASAEQWTREAIDGLQKPAQQPAPVQVIDCKVVESPVSEAGDTAKAKPAKTVTAERLQKAAEVINSRRNARRNNRRNNDG